MTRALLLTLAFLAACGPAQRLMREGRQAEAARQWGVAYRAYDSALRYKPGHPEALAHRGIAPCLTARLSLPIAGPPT